MNRIILLGLLIALTGCARTIYTKPGVSSAQLAQDDADCRYDVVKNTPTYDGVGDPIAAGWAQAERKEAILTACYASKGYSPQRK